MNLSDEEAFDIAKKVIDNLSKKLNLNILKNKKTTIKYSENRLEWKRFNFTKGWSIIFPAYSFQFQNDDGFYSITINDETQEPVYFLDGTEGRSPIGLIKKDIEGKYFIDWQP